MIDTRPCVGLRRGLALHKTALLEAVHHPGHGPARQVVMRADLVWIQRVIRPLEHRQGLGRRGMQAMERKATVDRVDQHVAESDQIAHRLFRPGVPPPGSASWRSRCCPNKPSGTCRSRPGAAAALLVSQSQ